MIRYEQFERRRIVIRKGHAGMAMYFLCYGSVGVIHDPDPDVLFSQSDPLILRPGASFGEVALMMRCTRNATVCCMDVCEFMVVDQENFYDLGLGEIVEREYYERVSFFTHHAVLHQYPSEMVRVMASESKSELIQTNKIICHDTSQVEITCISTMSPAITIVVTGDRFDS